MKATLAAIAVAVALSAPHAANAAAMQLRDQCENPSFAGIGKAACRNYLQGLAHGLYIGGGGRDCLPTDPSPEQLRLIVTRYFDGHPEELNENGPNVAARAILKAFHCD